MWSRVLPSARELLIATLAVLLALAVTNLVRPAEAGAPGPSTDVVFIATGENFPDALGAAAAAGALSAPVLLVQQNAVPQATLDELNRLAPSEIIIVGGTAVISATVFETLNGLSFGPTVTRIAGANRYETAAGLSAAVFPTLGYYPVAAYADAEKGTYVTWEDAVVLSVTLTAPVDGTVIVNSSATARHATEGEEVWCSITTDTEIEVAFQHSWASPGYYGQYGQLAGTRGFDVSAGEFTANLVCAHAGLGIPMRIMDAAMTAIFIADI